MTARRWRIGVCGALGLTLLALLLAGCRTPDAATPSVRESAESTVAPTSTSSGSENTATPTSEPGESRTAAAPAAEANTDRSAAAPTAKPDQPADDVSPPTATPRPHTPTATATPRPATATPRPSALATAPPAGAWTIAEMAARTYGGGALLLHEEMDGTAAFTRAIVTYPSDSLTIYGFMNTPRGPGPFPVIIVLHGYVEPAQYGIMTYTTRYADALARAGFLVIHPNLRNFPPSDEGPDTFRTGMTADILNLIAIVQAQGGQAGPLAAADGQSIGLWGHSLGGGLALRVATIGSAARAVLLYAALSGDEQRNYDYLYRASGGQRGMIEYHTPPEVVYDISPLFHLERITSAVSIHHGADDAGIPLAVAQDLCSRLQAHGKTVVCFTYADQGHIFDGSADQLLMQRSIEFFSEHLRPRDH